MPVRPAPLKSLSAMKRDPHVGPGLVDLFLSAGIRRRHAERLPRPEQMDAVDIAHDTSRPQAA
jgi:hypothetical protein